MDAASVGVGFNVATVFAALMVTAAAIRVLAGSRSSNVAALMVVGSIASLNVAVMLAVLLLPVAPAAGEVAVTVGGVVSASVVNDQMKSAARALPAESLTPVAPPITLAV